MEGLAQLIISCLSAYYWMEVTALALLPVGADPNASLYKAQASDQKTYFVKVKKGDSPAISLAILEMLQTAGVQQLIAPIKAREGNLTQQMGPFTLIVYPFVQGENGFSRSLTEEQWLAFGRALRQVHEIELPSAIQSCIRREDFSPKWRDVVRALYTSIEAVPAGDEVALQMGRFLQENRALIQRLVDRSEALSQKARSQPGPFVLCHSDMHAGNVLMDEKDAFYLVDWDNPILAPKERDLMFIGGGVGNVWNDPEEEKLFYRGYGPAEVDRTLLAYYRHERIVEDIALYAQELLLQPSCSKDRRTMYQQFVDMFAPRGVVEIACETDTGNG